MSSRSLAPMLFATVTACSLTGKLNLGGHGSSSPAARPPAPAVASTAAPAKASTPASPQTASAPASSAAEPDTKTNKQTEPEKPREHSDGLPAKLVELVRETYSEDPNRPGSQIGTRNNYFDALRPGAERFEAAWKAYEERAAIVGPAVAQAAELQKAGKLAEARAALEAVITPVTPDDSGKLDPHARKTLDPRDAELPAIDAWVRIVAAIGDRKPLVEAGHHYYIRRKVRDRDTEMWFWLSAVADKTIGNLVSESSTGIRHDVWKIWEDAAKVRGAYPFDPEGVAMAKGYFVSLAQFGLSWTVPSVEKGKKGDWVMINVEPAQIGEREIKHSSTEQWRVPTHCSTTTRISFWDGNGNPVYAEECEYSYHDRPIRLTAKLVEASPSWARSRDHVLVVGKLAAPGPSWQLVDAFVPDLRFSEGGMLF